MKKLDTGLLDAQLDEATGELWLGGEKLPPGVRTIGDMEAVIADKKFLKSADATQPAYFMYRNIWRKEDDKVFSGVGYDITVILPSPLGRELNKTLGHYHAVDGHSGHGHTFPEVYEVLQGKAIYVLQKLSGTNYVGKASGEIDEFIAIRASEGEKVVIPPDYGHVSINASTSEALVMSNVPDGSVGKGDYSLFRKMHGAAYFFNDDGSIVPNPAYKDAPPMQRFTAGEWKPNEKMAGLKENLYAAFLHDPGRFKWLLEPDAFF